MKEDDFNVHVKIHDQPKATQAVSDLLLADTDENAVSESLEEILSKSLPCDDEEVKFAGGPTVYRGHFFGGEKQIKIGFNISKVQRFFKRNQLLMEWFWCL